MLVLYRYKGQMVRIGDDITIIVKGIFKDIVTICIYAPDDIRVNRLEVHERMNFEDNYYSYLHCFDNTRDQTALKESKEVPYIPKVTFKKRKKLEFMEHGNV